MKPKKERSRSFEIPNLSIAFLVAELRGNLENAFVSKAQDLEQGWLKLKLSAKQGSASLIVAPEAVFLSQYRIDARRQSSGFGAFLNSRLKNRKILSFEQRNRERILLLEFAEFSLVIELFGEGNAVLLDREKKILMPKLKREWGVRSVKKGLLYEFPPERGLNPALLSEREFSAVLKKSGTDIIRALVKGVNIAPIVAEEILFQLKIEKSAEAKALPEKRAGELCRKIRDFHSAPDPEKEHACLCECKGKKFLLPFRPLLPGCSEIQQFDSINSALNELVLAQKFHASSDESGKKPALERTLTDQKEALEKALRSAAQNREKADAIYTHYSELQHALQSIKRGKEKKGVMYKFPSGVLRVKSIDNKRKRVVFEIG